MDPRFDDIQTKPENAVFRVVFYPDRIYHARYLNATRSSRYHYNVAEVRSQAEITAMKARVFLDGLPLAHVLRVEYRANRLRELTRERGRFPQGKILAWLRLAPGTARESTSLVRLHYCRWVDAYQVELWSTLDPPQTNHHDFQVLDLMGVDGEITRVPALDSALTELPDVMQIEAAFRENTVDLPFGYTISEPLWDNNYLRSHQVPNTQRPNAVENTVDVRNYLLDFRRGFFLQAQDVQPVRYENALMEEGATDAFTGNIVEMRWLLQRELGGNLVFFHEVTLNPGVIEGTHRHIGSEELYYVVEGEGVGYLGESDDPQLAELPVVQREIFGLGVRRCREVALRPGSVIYTKSGGIHGIRNTGDTPLKFVAFLYHSN